MTGKADPWILLVNLGMIWCFGFFLELLDDFDEGSQQRREALANWTMLAENWAVFRQCLCGEGILPDGCHQDQVKEQDVIPNAGSTPKD